MSNPSLLKRYEFTNKRDAYNFVIKLTKTLLSCDIEDLAQQIEFFRLESKMLTPGVEWSNTFKTKVISYIMDYDLGNEVIEQFTIPQYNEIQVTDIEAMFNPVDFTNITRQLLHLYITEGFTLEELATFYVVDLDTIKRWFKSVREDLVEPRQLHSQLVA